MSPTVVYCFQDWLVDYTLHFAAALEIFLCLCKTRMVLLWMVIGLIVALDGFKSKVFLIVVHFVSPFRVKAK